MNVAQQIIMVGSALGGVRGLVPTYYVNSARPDDTGDGRTPATAWKTIAKVNASTFVPNDVIAFCGGQTFSGTLTVPSSGSALAPITFMSYGIGRATIASAANNPGVLALNKAYFTVRDLIIVGTSQTASLADGVHVENSQAGNTKLNNISLINLDVSLYNQNGINVLGSAGTSGFNNVLISGCTTHDCAGGPNSLGTAGIFVASPNTGYGFGVTAPSHTNVTITGCTAYNNIGCASQTNWTGSGIVVAETGAGVVQFCVAHDNGASGTLAGAGPVGIWAADATNITIQFCESYNNTSAGADGGGFDIDGGCSNCVLQYNYSHGNKGPGFMLYSYADGQVTAWDNNTCRFNISQNDGVGGTGPVGAYGGISIQQDSTMTNAFVYGNTVICTAVPPLAVRGSMTGRVANNIFYAAASVDVVKALSATALVFTGNDYFSTGTFSINWNGTSYSSFAAWQTATSQEKIGGVNVGLNVNPQLHDPGNGGTIGGNGYNGTAPTAYDLNTGSPMLGAGVNLNTQFGINPGARDYYGNALSAPYAVGAYSGAGVAPIPVWLPIDGSVTGNSSAAITTVSLTTTKANDIIVVFGLSTNFAAGSVSSSPALTWTQRATLGAAGGIPISEFWALAPTPGTYAITFNPGAAVFTTVTALGINGAKTSAPYDVNAALPYTHTSTGSDPAVVSTTATDTLILGAMRFAGEPNPTAGSGFTQISGANYLLVEYKIVSAPQSNLSVTATMGVGGTNGSIADAIVRGP